MSFADIYSLPKDPKLIGFTGYGGAGKDEAAGPLIAHGYTRRCFGDLIKVQCNDLIKKHLGFSAFTEDRKQKHVIRPILETWGETNYDNISEEFYRDLPEYCVNTRISRVPEIVKWRERGGIIVAVDRPGLVPQTTWEEQIVSMQLAHEVVSLIIVNDSTVEKLHELILGLFFFEDQKHGWKEIFGDRPWIVRSSGGLQSLRQLDRTPRTL